MKDFFFQFWYLGAFFSVLYTAGSVWWTIKAEKRFRAYQREFDLLWRAHGKNLMRIAELEGYLSDKTPTCREFKCAPVILLPKRPA